MSVKIRLTRMGDKKSPFYRIIVADSRAPRDGRYIDLVGTYNPLSEVPEIKLDEEKIKKWLANGALPTETVRAILSDKGLMEKKVLPPKTKTAKKKKE